jgi:hypothetical protein
MAVTITARVNDAGNSRPATQTPDRGPSVSCEMEKQNDWKKWVLVDIEDKK